MQIHFKPVFAFAICLMFMTPSRGLAQSSNDRAGSSHNLFFEKFDRDPGWIGVNNRSATTHPPRSIRQDFGYSADSNHAGGKTPGEIGGMITPAGEAAYYAKKLDRLTLNDKLEASGTIVLKQGSTNLLLGFFHSDSINEWRTPNSLAIRLNGRGDRFFAYVEYCTSQWRAGADTTTFPTSTDPSTGRKTLIGFPCNQPLAWSLRYDPTENQGRGRMIATIGDATAVCLLDETHKEDGAEFNRFGILNVIKSADTGSEAWVDDISINRGPTETFSSDPNWESNKSRSQYTTRDVRPWFDFGYSQTHFAGGQTKGEIGGRIFRGDCRYPEKMACFGAELKSLNLAKPLHASGKIAMKRGVTDSTSLIGFYHSEASMRSNDSQNDGVPECVLGIHVEGPSRDGFRVYPVLRSKGKSGQFPTLASFPFIRPDGKSHDWSMDYNPAKGDQTASITIALDDQSGVFRLPPESLSENTTFNRFGIVTSWIDGNSQEIYLDDIYYTVDQQE